MELGIRHLIDVPDSLPALARWFVDEWEPYYGPDGPGDAESDLRAARSRDHLPLCLVALDGDVPVGTVALRDESVASHRDLGPWLAALIVAPEHRRRGIGSALVDALVNEARRLGFERIYSATEKVPPGWQVIGRAPTLRGEVAVCSLELGTG